MTQEGSLQGYDSAGPAERGLLHAGDVVPSPSSWPRTAPGCCPPHPRSRRASGWGPTGSRIGTTVLALTYRDGVLIAGDRRATMGNLIAQRDLEKVHPADDHTASPSPAPSSLALDMVRLYQVELTHFEKIEGVPMTPGGQAAPASRP